jgi:hypothetical protein
MPTINTLDATTSGAAAQTSAAGVGMPLTAASEGRHHVDQDNTAEPPTRHAGYFREQADRCIRLADATTDPDVKSKVERATIELAGAAGIARGAKVLDIGSGLIPSGAMLEGREEQCRYAR